MSEHMLDVFKNSVKRIFSIRLKIGYFVNIDYRTDSIIVYIPEFDYHFFCSDLSRKIIKGYSANEFFTEFEKNFKGFVLNSIFRKK